MAGTQPEAEDVTHGIVIGNVPHLEGDTADIVEIRVAAEEAGWDGVFMGDPLVRMHSATGRSQQSTRG